MSISGNHAPSRHDQLGKLIDCAFFDSQIIVDLNDRSKRMPE